MKMLFPLKNILSSFQVIVILKKHIISFSKPYPYFPLRTENNEEPIGITLFSIPKYLRDQKFIKKKLSEKENERRPRYKVLSKKS